MRIGIPRETKPDEYRVSLSPAAARELVQAGHSVWVEHEAGEGARFLDPEYESAGATIVDAEQAWSCDLVLKVKEPMPAEFGFLREGQILFTYLHLAANPDVAAALCQAGTTAIAYETVEDSEGGLPLLAPMSEIAGRLAVQAGATYLERQRGGRGVLLGGVPGVEPGSVVVLGGGMVGFNAALIAAGMRADVRILETNLGRMRHLDAILAGRVTVLHSTQLAVAELVAAADLVIGSVLVPGARAPRLVTRAMVSDMKDGAVIVDVAVDQGGCIETAEPTTHSHPAYTVDGVVHYCVANMPGAVPATSTQALVNATLPYVLYLGREGAAKAMLERDDVRAGVNVHEGKVVNPAVAEALLAA